MTRAQTPIYPITAQEIADEAARCREAGAASCTSTCATTTAPPPRPRTGSRAGDRGHPPKTDASSRSRPAEPWACRITSAPSPRLQAGDGDAQLRLAQLRRRRVREHAARDRELAGRIRAGGQRAPSSSATRSATSKRASCWLKPACSSRSPPLPVRARVARRHRRHRGEPPHLVRARPRGRTWAVAATGRHQRPMTELAMRLGGHARVGLEDNIYLEKGVLAEGSRPSSPGPRPTRGASDGSPSSPRPPARTSASRRSACDDEALLRDAPERRAHPRRGLRGPPRPRGRRRVVPVRERRRRRALGALQHPRVQASLRGRARLGRHLRRRRAARGS
jgi:hypothetical protein